MARVKRGVTKHARHKKVISAAKGARAGYTADAAIKAPPAIPDIATEMSDLASL